jgi:hypothetical protein
MAAKYEVVKVFDVHDLPDEAADEYICESGIYESGLYWQVGNEYNDSSYVQAIDNWLKDNGAEEGETVILYAS